MIPKTDWKWFGHAGHLIVSRDCVFHLCTQIGDVLVSTVGEYWPPRAVREIHAGVRDAGWLAEHAHLKGDEFDHAYRKRFGYETIGCDRKYETMVFQAGKPCDTEDCGCGLPQISGSEIDFCGYNDAGSATRGHLAMCERWAAKEGICRNN